jgi:hypothetical protein
MEVEEAVKLCIVGAEAGGAEPPPPQPENPLRTSREVKAIARKYKGRFIRANTV